MDDYLVGELARLLARRRVTAGSAGRARAPVEAGRPPRHAGAAGRNDRRRRDCRRSGCARAARGDGLRGTARSSHLGSFDVDPSKAANQGHVFLAVGRRAAPRARGSTRWRTPRSCWPRSRVVPDLIDSGEICGAIVGRRAAPGAPSTRVDDVSRLTAGSSLGISRAGAGAPPRPARDRARAPRAARSCGTRGRRAPRRGARRVSATRGERHLDALLAHLLRRGGDALRRAAPTTYEPFGPRRRALGDDAPQPGREARLGTGVAGGAGRVDAEEDRVAVAVVADLDDRHRVPRRRSLVPVLLARAAPEPRLARLAGPAKRLLVHPGEHQHAAARRVLHDRGVSSAGAQILTFHPASFSSAFNSGSRSGRSCTIEAMIAASAPTSNASARCACLTCSAGGDHGHLHGRRDRTREREVVARTRAVGVDRGDEKLARAPLDRLDAPSRPRHGRAASCPACVTTSPARASIAQTTACEPNSSASAVRIDGSSNAARLTATLSAPGPQQRARIVEPGDAAADGERDRQLGRRPLDQLEDRPATLERRGDVEEDELVGTELRVARRELDRLTHLAQIDEVDALDDAAAGDVEAGDHALLDHASAFSSSRAPARALRSGWNWTPATAAVLDRGDDRCRRGPPTATTTSVVGRARRRKL